MPSPANNPRLTPELEATLRRYVLGALDEPVRTELEERLVTEPEVFEALGVVEDELVEAYLDGALPAPERRSFERHFLTSPDRAARLRFARSLRARASSNGIGASVASAVPDGGRSLLRQPQLLALAAMLLLSLAANLWLAARRPAVAPPEHVAAPVAAAAAQRAAAPDSDDSRAALQREREARTRAEGRATALEAELRRSRGVIVIPTFALAAGVLRAEGTLKRVALPKSASAVRLELVLPADEHALYRATLVDAEGEEIWAASKLRSERMGERFVVPLVLPASLLPRGDYLLRLFGGATTVQVEAVATYAFRSSPGE
jgi:hypothetical protein